MGRERDRTRDQDRDRDRVMLHLCESMRDTASHLLRSADQLNLQLQDPVMARDRDMDRDMDQLRDHLRLMTDQLDEALKTMDRLRLRLDQAG